MVLAALLPGGVFVSEAAAQDSPKAKTAQLNRPEEVSRWRAELKGKVGFNMSANFTGLGAFAAQTADGVNAFGVTRGYDDGFNNADAVTGGDGRTSDWRYYNAGQVAGTMITMNRSSVVGNATAGNVGSEAAPGLSLDFTYEMGRNAKRTWGFKGGLGYSLVETKDRQTLLATEQRQVDTFDGSAIVIPAPDTATISRLPNTPVASTTILFAGGASIAGNRELSANMLDFRIGPYVDFELGKRTSISLHGGLAVAMISSEYSVNETATIAGRNPVLAPGVIATPNFQGSSTETGLVAGGYVGLDCRVKLSDRWSAIGGMQFQYLQDFKQSLGGRQATLRLDQTVFATLGLSFAF